MTEVQVAVGGRGLAEQYHDAICELYDEVFSSPPFVWSGDASHDHDQELCQLMIDATFGIALAVDLDHLVGFAYGHRLPTDHGWWGDFSVPLPADLTREWDGRTFALIEFAVDEEKRGRGVGKQLLRALFATRTEERAILSVQPTATQTQEIYRHLNWRRVGRKGPLEGALTPYWDIFLLNLRRSQNLP